MRDSDIVLLDKYLNNELSGPELAGFEERLANEPGLQRIAFAERFLERCLRPNAIGRARRIAELLGEDLWAEDEKNGSIKSKKPPASYQIEAPMSLFCPAADWEDAADNRSSQQASHNPMQNLVLLPLNDIECKTSLLNFDFELKLPFPVELTIVNNHEELLLKEKIPQDVYEHTAHLNDFKPGRYYWMLRAHSSVDEKMKQEYGSAVGCFFIRRSLRPD